MTVHAWLMGKEKKKSRDKTRRTYEYSHVTTPMQFKWDRLHLIADVTEDAED